MLVFDEIDVGISGGTAEVVGRLLADLAQHVQLLCITQHKLLHNQISIY